MGLSTSHLEAFVEVAKTRSFSGAARNLHITQSALSQRVMNLEAELESSLIIRDPSGLRLTPTGEELLRYCRAKEGLEQEFIGKVMGKKNTHGIIRIAGFSSVMRSMILPVVSDYVKAHPDVRIEFFSRELRELLPMLASNEVDFIITTIKSPKQDLECLPLGVEENVLVRPASGKYHNVYLDHDVEDVTTFTFLKQQEKKAPKIERSYFDEVYAIMDAVALGLGQAVLPKHLVEKDKRLKIVSGQCSLEFPIYLQFYRQPFYSRLQQGVIDLLKKSASNRL